MPTLKPTPAHEYKPTPHLQAEVIAPARLEAGVCVRTCPLCGTEIRESQHGYRATNFLSHFKGKGCRARQRVKG